MKSYSATSRNSNSEYYALSKKSKDVVTRSSSVLTDENMVYSAEKQWEFGDWKSLTEINIQAARNHDAKAKLAIFLASGLLQIGRHDEAKKFIYTAIDYGIDRSFIARILVSGVYNSIALASIIKGNEADSLKYFKFAMEAGCRVSDVKLLAGARFWYQKGNLNSIIYKDSELWHEVSNTDSRRINNFKCDASAAHNAKINYDIKSVYSSLFSDDVYSAEDHIQYHYTLLKIHELGFSSDFTLLDVSSGRGHLISQVKKLYPGTKITSCDLKRYHNVEVYKFIECDLSISSNRENLLSAGCYDVLVCTDVLEHLEKSYVADVIEMFSKLSNYVILAIANHSDVWNGHELHLIQEGNGYWDELINPYFITIHKQNTYNDRLMLYVLKKK